MATEPRPLVYAPQLDGLRAVAVTAVAWSHWLPQWQFGLPFGAGVHLFFVLSGWLITRILLDLRTAPHPLHAVGRFYLRRAVRLVPAFVVVLSLAASADVPLVRDTWPWHAAYLSNLFIASTGQWQGYVSHFWSLAVEEQFYLLWPWLVVFAPVRLLTPLIAATLLTGPASHLVAASYGLREPFWALVPGGSADSLAVGAWLALGVHTAPPTTPWLVRTPVVVSTAALWMALAIAERAVTLPVAVAIWRQLLQAILFGAVVWCATAGFTGITARVLTHPAVVGLGRISYGVYLIHAFAPVVVWTAARALGAEAVLPQPVGLRAALYAATTVLLATAMWWLVERPCLRLKAYLPYLTRLPRHAASGR